MDNFGYSKFRPYLKLFILSLTFGPSMSILPTWTTSSSLGSETELFAITYYLSVLQLVSQEPQMGAKPLREDHRPVLSNDHSCPLHISSFLVLLVNILHPRLHLPLRQLICLATNYLRAVAERR